MGCPLPKGPRLKLRIGYWATCCLEPSVEAISKEVLGLVKRFDGRFLFSISPHYRFRISRRNRWIGFHSFLDPMVRPLIRILERQVDVSHVYGELSPWVFYKCLKLRPVVLTVASDKGTPVLEFIDRCRAVVLQSENSRRRLSEMGIDPAKLHLIYPGVDIDRYRPAPSPANLKRPRVLFATAPRSTAELEGRGVILLLSAAALVPEIQFRLLFRVWMGGDSAFEEVNQEVHKRGLSNVVLTRSCEQDMSKVYPGYHLTLIPYTRQDGGKECPNSAIEGLACGLPPVVTSVVPFASFVSEHKCGLVCDATPEALAHSVREGLEQHAELSLRARLVAEKLMSSEQTYSSYARIYSAIS